MKNTKTIFKLLIFAGIFILLGTAGASDLGRLSITEIVSKVTLGFSLILTGRFGIAVLKHRCAKRKRIISAQRRKAQRSLVSAA
ncbi:MAG: hypothetical protein IJE44_04135 [Clostridia bacterium]|nr:hypothetical protein [Clostridia bacterium]